jgi:hypothetical protein
MKKLCFAVLTAAMIFVFATATDATAEIAVAPGGQGDALLGELYRVDYDSSYVTFFTITNTSDKFVEIHVRLRSGKYSIEVWDKEYILTPYDKIWFQVEADADDLGYIYGEQIAYPWPLSTELLEDVCFAPSDNIETTVGYIEVFGIGQGDTATQIDEDCPNALMGHVYLGSFQSGEYLGYKMLAIENFRTSDVSSGAYHRDGITSGYIDKSYDDYYKEPDWATTYGPSWNDGDDANMSGSLAGGGVNEMWSLDEVEDALNKAHIKSDYFNREHSYGGLTTTLGVVTFPAKYLHWNFENWVTADSVAAAANRADCISFMDTPMAVPIDAYVWNMDEDMFQVSPSTTEPLPYEVNLIPVGDLSQTRFADWFLVYNSFPFNAPWNLYEEYPMGWFQIDFKVPVATWDPRECGIFPGSNLVMHYEDINYPHARGFEWHWGGTVDIP